MSRISAVVQNTMEFVHDLLENDGTDPRITAALEKVRFIAVPVVNPDGYEMSRTVLLEQKRKNCRIEAGRTPTFEQCANPANSNAGVDLNRNYGAFWGGVGANVSPTGGSYRGPAPFSEPETRNMRDLFASHQVVVALSNHTPDAKVLRRFELSMRYAVDKAVRRGMTQFPDPLHPFLPGCRILGN